jgi:hypothetical protein
MMDKFERIILLQKLAIARTDEMRTGVPNGDFIAPDHPLMLSAQDAYGRVIDALLEDFPPKEFVGHRVQSDPNKAFDTLDRDVLTELDRDGTVGPFVINTLLVRYRLLLSGMQTRGWGEFVRVYKDVFDKKPVHATE